MGGDGSSHGHSDQIKPLERIETNRLDANVAAGEIMQPFLGIPAQAFSIVSPTVGKRTDGQQREQRHARPSSPARDRPAR